MFAKPGPAAGFGVRHPEEPQGRVITLDPTVVETLRRWRVDQEIERVFHGTDYHDHGLVFCQPDGRPLDGRSLVRWHFKRLLKKAGLPTTIRFHDLRHTFVSRALQAGANVRAVSELAGHHDPGFTVKRYAHAFDEDKKEAVERLSRRLFGNGARPRHRGTSGRPAGPAAPWRRPRHVSHTGGAFCLAGAARLAGGWDGKRDGKSSPSFPSLPRRSLDRNGAESRNRTGEAVSHRIVPLPTGLQRERGDVGLEGPGQPIHRIDHGILDVRPPLFSVLQASPFQHVAHS